ncbi:MAG: HAD-IA family hydrolase [Candidatus Aenigmarchaeota archaeon]|nr:HAD-IA family hydrolase [Candidatus Aenigmarchaeota archaeon]
MIKAIVFDLDDTLYDEKQFVISGFSAVASYISKKYSINQNEVLKKLITVLEKQGRGKTFNIALKELNINDEKIIQILIDIYRKHKPNLSLYDDTLKTIQTLKKQGYKLGIITDGLVDVQKNKVHTLKIESFFNYIIFSDKYGIDKQKPSEFPYLKIIELMNIKNNEMVYVGDNPNKDFITAKKLGIHTIRLMKGNYKTIKLSNNYEAKYQINDLNSLINLLIKINQII